jgi:hypothetical protein
MTKIRHYKGRDYINIPMDTQKKKRQTSKKGCEIVIDPDLPLKEANGKTAVATIGRFQPLTTGHELLVNKMIQIAKSKGATPLLYLTHTNDPKKNPLSYDDKHKFAKKAFGSIVQKSNAKTLIDVVKDVSKGYDNLVFVVGDDRVEDVRRLLTKYNKKDFDFENIEVVSAGQRTDPDDDQSKSMKAKDMSASVMRKLASENKKEEFIKGLPTKLKNDGDEIFNAVRSGMDITEAVMSMQTRRKMAISAKKNRSKMMMGRKRAAKKHATPEQLKKRATKQAINQLRKKFVKTGSYADLAVSQKQMIDAKVQKKKAFIKKTAKKLIPILRKKEAQKGKKSVDENFSVFESDDRTIDRLKDRQKNDLEKLKNRQSRQMDAMQTRKKENEERKKEMENRSNQKSTKEDINYHFESLIENDINEEFDGFFESSKSMYISEDIDIKKISQLVDSIVESETYNEFIKHDPWSLKKVTSLTLRKGNYKKAKEVLLKVISKKKKENKLTHDIEYYASVIAKEFKGVDTKILADMVK